MLELYDQAVREAPGGAMCVYLEQESIPNEKFVCARMGGEARIIQSYRARANREKSSTPKNSNFLLRFNPFCCLYEKDF
jgi:hypothetical protein